LRIILMVVFAFLLGGFVQKAQTKSTKSSRVSEKDKGLASLDTEKFSSGNVCKYFWSSNCGFCNRMKPEWDKFEDSYQKENKVKIESLECSEGKNVDERKKYDVAGFPTIIMTDVNGNKIGDFNQSYQGLEYRKSKYFREFCKKYE